MYAGGPGEDFLLYDPDSDGTTGIPGVETEYCFYEKTYTG
jgi:hypothetical protein